MAAAFKVTSPGPAPSPLASSRSASSATPSTARPRSGWTARCRSCASSSPVVHPTAACATGPAVGGRSGARTTSCRSATACWSPIPSSTTRSWTPPRSRSPAATPASSPGPPATPATASRSAASATSAARSVTSGSRAPTSSLRPSWRVRSDEDTSRARDGLLPNESLDFAPKSLPRAVARIEHVAAGIDHELDPLRCEGRQLVEHPLRSEIGGGEIEQAVRDQHVQLRIGGEDLAQLGDRLRRVDAAAEIPVAFDGAVQHLVGAIGPPVELVCQKVNRGTRQRRLQRIAGGITEPRAARIRIGIEAAYRAIVAPRHLAVLAVEFAAEFADVEAAGKPAAPRLVDAGELGDLVGKTIGGLLVRLALDEVGQEFAARVSLDVGEIGALDRAFRLARHRHIAR